MKPTSSDSRSNNPLYHLDLSSILEALFLTASEQEGRIDVKGRYRLPGKKAREIHEESLKAFSVFEGWPGSFHKFLDQVRSRNKSSKTNTGLISNFGSLYQRLYTPGRLSQSVSQVLRNEFEKYVSEYWDGGYLAQSKWFTAGKFEGRYISQRKACRELNLDAVVLERFVSTGKLKGVVRKNGAKRLFLVEAEGVKQLKLEPSLYISIDSVSRLLGISRLNVLRLVEGTLLIPARGCSVDNRKVWKFDKIVVQGFLTEVLSKITPERNRSTAQSFTTDLDALRRKLAPHRYGLHTLVRDILSGLLIPRDESAGKVGLSRLLFCDEEVQQYINTRADRREESPWVIEGLKKLGIRAGVAHFLASKGLIDTSARTHQGRIFIPITDEAVISFESNYLFAIDVAREIGITTSFLIQALGTLNVHPVSGKEVDDGTQYVFKKTDLEFVDLKKLSGIFPRKKKSKQSHAGASFHLGEPI